jgi:hypothetical protein
MIYSQTVINWLSVLANSFWILGAAILLAAFSYQYGTPEENGRQTTLKERLNEPAFLRFFWLSFVFIAIGLAGTSQRSWEMILWGVMAVLSLYQMVRS